jgi:hypothetical protein
MGTDPVCEVGAPTPAPDALASALRLRKSRADAAACNAQA